MPLTFSPIPGRNPQIEVEGDLPGFVPLVAELESWALAQEHEVFDIFTDPSTPVRIWEETAPAMVFGWIDILSRSAVLDVHDPQDTDKRALIREMINGMEPAERMARLAEEGDPKFRTIKLKARRSGDISEVESVALALDARRDESEVAAELLSALGAAGAGIGPVIFSAIERELITRAAEIRHCGDYGQLWWNETQGTVLWVVGDADDPERGYTSVGEIQRLFRTVDGVEVVLVYDEHGPDDDQEPDSPWVQLPTTTLVS